MTSRSTTEDGALDLSKLEGITDDLRDVLLRLRQAQVAANRLQFDFHPTPAERAAIALITRDGHAAGLWADLCNCLTAAAETLALAEDSLSTTVVCALADEEEAA